MANGFFSGGFAEGAAIADALGIKQQEADTRLQALTQARERAVTTQVDKLVADNTDFISDTITQARKAGASPDQIRQLIAKPKQNFEQVLRRTGRDPTAIFDQFDAMIGIPQAVDTPSPTTEIGKLRSDLKSGFITQEEFSGRVNRLTREGTEPNVVEGISRKIASGEALSEGETRVYDDALKADPIARLLSSTLGTAAPRPTFPAPVAPARPDPLRLR